MLQWIVNGPVCQVVAPFHIKSLLFVCVPFIPMFVCVCCACMCCANLLLTRIVEMISAGIQLQHLAHYVFGYMTIGLV